MPSIDTHVLAIEILENGLRFALVKEAVSKHLKPSYSIVDYGDITFAQTVFKDDSIVNSDLLSNEIAQILQRILLRPDHIVIVVEQGGGRKVVKRYAVNDIVKGALDEKIELDAMRFKTDLFTLYYQAPNRYDLKNKATVPIFSTHVNQALIKQFTQLATLNECSPFMLDWSSLALLRLIRFQNKVPDRDVTALQGIVILEGKFLNLFIMKGSSVCFTQRAILDEESDQEKVESCLAKVRLFFNAFYDASIDILDIESCVFYSSTFSFNDGLISIKKALTGINIVIIATQWLSIFNVSTNNAASLLPFSKVLGASLVFFDSNISILPIKSRPQFLIEDSHRKIVKQAAGIIAGLCVLLGLLFIGQGVLISNKIEKIETIQSVKLPELNLEEKDMFQSNKDRFKVQYKEKIEISSSLNNYWSTLLTKLPDDVVVDAVSMISLNELQIKGRAFYKDSIYNYLETMKSTFPEQRVDNMSTLRFDGVPLYKFSLYLSKDEGVF